MSCYCLKHVKFIFVVTSASSHKYTNAQSMRVDGKSDQNLDLVGHRKQVSMTRSATDADLPNVP